MENNIKNYFDQNNMKGELKELAESINSTFEKINNMNNSRDSLLDNSGISNVSNVFENKKKGNFTKRDFSFDSHREKSGAKEHNNEKAKYNYAFVKGKVLKEFNKSKVIIINNLYRMER